MQSLKDLCKPNSPYPSIQEICRFEEMHFQDFLNEVSELINYIQDKVDAIERRGDINCELDWLEKKCNVFKPNDSSLIGEGHLSQIAALKTKIREIMERCQLSNK